MGGRRCFGNISVSSLREQWARLTLRKVRKEGHIYVELRRDGKRFVFFCVLCHAPCYSETVLFDHLRGHLHRERLAVAEVTLLGENPWPFNDGVYFFHDSADEVYRNDRLLMSDTDRNESALTVYDCGRISKDIVGCNGNGDCGNRSLVIPGVLRNVQMTCLEAKFIGFGEIGARIHEINESTEEISRIWCSWLGKRSFSDEDLPMLPRHEFGIVTFSYNYNLGRKPVWSDLSRLCASSTCSGIECIEDGNKRRRRLLSDPDDISQSLCEQGGSSVEYYQPSDSPILELVSAHAPSDGPTLELVSAHQLQRSKSSRRRIRREMRQQQRLAAERMCDICQIKLLPGKDVACLLNMETGRLACSSRNATGAFHVFHTSCLVHWILLCEFENWKNSLAIQEAPHRPRRKTRASTARTIAKKRDNERRATPKQISSVFCPECQGTGINIQEDQLEKPSYLLSEMFNCKIKSKDAKRAWMKAPETLQNCSTGLHFPCQSNEIVQEKVAHLKLLHFYRANEWN
ncbi:hypothetical protein IFM89_022238 [Coptis chinensis]|uniref:C2H2-type domain-containing protein n=1 Tax=Coptis chinensis TaxID=261450 RepID=A0A835H0E3_9MAGN|nr:hypothetical protein IFM89_022238 [Coptis chinensis]